MRSSAPRVLPASFAVLALLLASCTESRFVAVEPAPASAEIRVVAAIGSNDVRSLRALTRDEPFELPLKDVFEGGGALEVYVLHYDLATLAAAFPGLAGRDAAAVAAELDPDFGAEGPGAYAIPSPLEDRVYTAVIDEGGAADVEYDAIGFAEARERGDVAFVFRLPADAACPPGQGTLRVFDRDDPGKVCVLERNAACEWHDERACSYLPDLFGRPTDRALEVREAPPARLILEPSGDRCAELQDRIPGESRAFTCPTEQGTSSVSVQNTARGAGGAPWVPVEADVPALQGIDVRFTRAAEGAIYAFRRDSRIGLRRLAPMAGDALQDQALRRIAGSFSIDIELSDAGELEGVSSDAAGDQVVVSASLRPYVLERDEDAESDPATKFSFFEVPIPIEESALPAATRVGPVVSGPGQSVYAAVETGVTVLRVARPAVTAVATTDAAHGIRLTRAEEPRIAAVRRLNRDLVVVWTNDGTTHVFGADAAPILIGCALGEVLAVLDGPRIVRRTRPERPFVVELVDLGAVPGPECPRDLRGETLFVPPSHAGAETEVLSFDTNTRTSEGGRETIVYRYGRSGGVLDLESGLSTAVGTGAEPIDGALFAQPGNTKLWLLFAPRGSIDLRGFLLPLFEGP